MMHQEQNNGCDVSNGCDLSQRGRHPPPSLTPSVSPDSDELQPTGRQFNKNKSVTIDSRTASVDKYDPNDNDDYDYVDNQGKKYQKMNYEVCTQAEMLAFLSKPSAKIVTLYPEQNDEFANDENGIARQRRRQDAEIAPIAMDENATEDTDEDENKSENENESENENDSENESRNRKRKRNENENESDESPPPKKRRKIGHAQKKNNNNNNNNNSDVDQSLKPKNIRQKFPNTDWDRLFEETEECLGKMHNIKKYIDQHEQDPTQASKHGSRMVHWIYAMYSDLDNVVNNYDVFTLFIDKDIADSKK